MRQLGARALRGLWPFGLSLVAALALGGAGAVVAAPHARAASGGWQYLVRGDSAPLLTGWKHPGLQIGRASWWGRG